MKGQKQPKPMLKHLLERNTTIIKLSEYSDRLLKYLVAAVLIAVPLFPKFPFLNVPGTQVSIRLEDFLILATLIVYSFTILPSVFTLFQSRIFRAVMLFLLVGLVSVYSGIFLTKTVIFHIGILHWARRVEYLSCLLIGAQSVKNRENLKFYSKLLVIVVTLTFLYGVGQKHLNWPVITTQNSEYSKGIALRYTEDSHLISTFAGHYDLATYIILTTPIFYALLLGGKAVANDLGLSKHYWLGNGILFSVITMSLWLLVNAASRISMVSYLGSVTLVLLVMKKYKFIPLVIIFTLIFTSMSSNLIDRYTNILEVATKKVFSFVPTAYAQEIVDRPIRSGSSLLEKVNPISVFEDRSTSIRLNIEWPRALRALNKNPILGTGFSSITLATDNGYLRLLGEVGILGFVSFCLLLFRILRYLFSLISFKHQSLASVYTLGLLAAIPGIMLNMVFIDVLEASKFAISFWLLIGFAVGLSNNEK